MSHTMLAELPEGMRDPIRRTANRGLMVAFINADLARRASLDVRKSVVLYDDAGLFEYAMSELPAADVQAQLVTRLGVLYWSKGI